MLEPRTETTTVATQFDLPAKVNQIERIGVGNINDSYLVRCIDGSRFLLQRINAQVFGQPAQVMKNIEAVLTHLSSRINDERRVLRLIPTKSGASYLVLNDNYWRMYPYVKGAYVRHLARSPDEARATARAFGAFQKALSDMDPRSLLETIEGFHDTPARYEAFEQAATLDIAGRSQSCATEIAFAKSRKNVATLLTDAAAEIPIRVVHNDAKISNVLLDERTRQPLCVVDLDTVMPGMSLFDFGDMVRSMTSGREEDDSEWASIEFKTEMFRALLEGYFAEMGELLCKRERELLFAAGMVITYEQGLRFLSDYLSGDRYYRVADSSHNLRRARAQFALLASMERQRADAERIVKAI